jgi:hypothetical protein
MSEMYARRSSLTNRSCSVRLARSTRPLGLAGIGAEDLDVQLCKSATELGHTLAALRIASQDAEDGMLVGVKGKRAAMTLQIVTQRLEIGICALAANKPQLHEPGCSIVDEDQQGTRLTAILEPAMFAAVDLNQFAIVLAT